MGFDYAKEKFYIAVRSLVEGDNPLKDRLLNAALAIHTVKPSDLPDGALADFDFIEADLLSAKEWSSDDGQWKASIEALDEFKARDLAARILSVYMNVHGVHDLL